MRLDHLLSKEHLAAGRPCRGVGVVVQAHARAERVRGGAHGWNIDYGSSGGGWRLVRLRSSGRGEGTTFVWLLGGLGTLLGPEGTAGWLLSRGDARAGALVWGVVLGGGLRVVTGSRTTPALRGRCRRGRVWRVGRCLRTAQWTRASL